MKPYSNQIFCLFLGVVIIVLFRNTISTLFGGMVGNLSLGILFISIPFFLKTIFYNKLKCSSVLIVIYIFYLVLLTLFFYFFSDFGQAYLGIIGFTNLGALLIFWLVVLRNPEYCFFELAIKLFVLIGVINSVGAIIQFYISSDIFGLINNSIFSNEDNFEKANFTKRAVSFISSPQSLSLYFAFSLCVSTLLNLGVVKGGIIRGLLVIGGVLTISKAFFVFLFVFITLNYLSFKSLFKLLSCFLLFFSIIMYFQEYFQRVHDLLHFINYIEEYSAYKIWSDSINFGLEFPKFLFGNGIGVFSRGAQELGGYTLLHGSTESFFIQLFVELGFVGIFLFSSILIIALYKSMIFNRVMFSALSGLCVISLFTPSVYGYSIGLIFYFSLVYGLVVDSKYLNYGFRKESVK